MFMYAIFTLVIFICVFFQFKVLLTFCFNRLWFYFIVTVIVETSFDYLKREYIHVELTYLLLDTKNP